MLITSEKGAGAGAEATASGQTAGGQAAGGGDEGGYFVRFGPDAEGRRNSVRRPPELKREVSRMECL